MSLTTLRLTQFTVQKLQCIGGRGRAVPYQITTYEGTELGSFGKIPQSAMEASNSDTFEKSLFSNLKPKLRSYR